MYYRLTYIFSIVFVIVLFSNSVWAGSISLSSPAPDSKVYYRTDATDELKFEFAVSGVSLSLQLSSCDLTIEKGTKSESIDCASQLKDSESYTISVSELFSDMESASDPEGEYVFTFTLKWIEEDSTTDGDTDYVDEDEDKESVNIATATQSATVVFDDTAPEKVEQVDAPISGENALKFAWSKVSKDVKGDAEPGTVKYDICVDPEEGKVSLSDCEVKLENVSGESDGDKLTYKVDGLTNGTTYFLKVRAHDLAGNVGVFSDEVSGTPQPVADFWEYYKENGGKESGGFCFIATEVFNGYDSPQVLVLRDFRDKILLKFSLGRKFVNWYYSHGRSWACSVHGHSFAKSVVKILLWPLVAMSLFVLSPWRMLLLLAFLGFLLGMIKKNRKKESPVKEHSATNNYKNLLLLLLLPASLLVIYGGNASAESERTSSVSVMGGRFELSNIDDGINGNPSATVFGDTADFTFAFSYEHFLFESDPAGVLSLGGSLGFYWITGDGIYMGGANEGEKSAADNTSFNLLPLRLCLSYRVEQLDTYFGIPFVPYVKGGLDYYIWWIKDNHGDIADYKDTKGYGGTFGLEGGAGLMFLLDFVDPAVAENFDVEFGVNNTYIFFEYMYAWVNDFGSDSSFDLSSGYFMIGLMFDI